MKNKLKLLYIVEAMGGGVFTYIVDLTNALADRYSIYIAFAIRIQTPSDYKRYFDKRIHLLEVEELTRSIDPVNDLKAFLKIKRIAKEIQPDIIHLHSSKAGTLGRWAFNGYKIPILYTPHGYSFLMSNQSKLKRIIYKMIEALSAKRYCTTVSCSRSEHEETLKLTKRAVYVDNSINMIQLQKLIDSIDIEEKKQPFTVFTLGRICSQKNPALFNTIATMMPDIHFLWIGDGELREQLTAPNIEVTGWLERSRALQKALEADAFLLPSLWEGMPISLLESMFMRKPCIVSDVIGNHDVIHNGKNGYVCSEVSEFKESIEKCKSDQINDILENAYQDIVNHYNTQIMAEQYAHIYTAVTNDMVKKWKRK